MLDKDTFIQFNVGDVVSLPSGGPNLTVYKLEGAAAVSCVWFDEAGVLRREMLPVACLVSGDDEIK
jgi:uncharacterized protein YodC (DUF2158 family)